MANGTVETVGEGRPGGQAVWWRTDFARWLLFSLVCAGGSLGLAWLSPVVPLWTPLRAVAMLLAVLVLPLASALVPVLFLRRVPRKQRKVAWQLVFPLAAGVALAVFGNGAGDRVALAERGEWTDAVVVQKEETRTNQCDLRMPGGSEISPSLSEGEGCDDSVSEGDKLKVRYDPEGVASPTEDADSASNGGFLAVLFLVAVVMGTWGGVRQNRWDREYDARELG